MRLLPGISLTGLMAYIKPSPFVRHLVQAGFTKGRQLDTKNAQPGSLGADFGLLGIKFWDEVDKHDARNKHRRGELESLNKWLPVARRVAGKDRRAALADGLNSQNGQLAVLARMSRQHQGAGPCPLDAHATVQRWQPEGLRR